MNNLISPLATTILRKSSISKQLSYPCNVAAGMVSIAGVCSVGYGYVLYVTSTRLSGTGMTVIQKLQNLSGTVWDAYENSVPAVGYFFKDMHG